MHVRCLQSSLSIGASYEVTPTAPVRSGLTQDSQNEKLHSTIEYDDIHGRPCYRADCLETCVLWL